MSKIKFSTLLLILLAAIYSCDTVGFEDIEAEVIPMEEEIDYAEEIAPIMSESCTVCHAPGGQASFAPLTNYTEVSNRIASILDRVQRPNGDPLKMPPGGNLPQSQIDFLIQWQEEGVPEFDSTPPDAPENVIDYDEDVAPIVGASCVACHSPNGPASFYPLTNYTEVSNGITSILDRIQRPAGDPLKMPPGGSLTDTQIGIFIEWQRGGLIESE